MFNVFQFFIAQIGSKNWIKFVLEKIIQICREEEAAKKKKESEMKQQLKEDEKKWAGEEKIETKQLRVRIFIFYAKSWLFWLNV